MGQMAGFAAGSWEVRQPPSGQLKVRQATRGRLLVALPRQPGTGTTHKVLRLPKAHGIANHLAMPGILYVHQRPPSLRGRNLSDLIHPAPAWA